MAPESATDDEVAESSIELLVAGSPVVLLGAESSDELVETLTTVVGASSDEATNGVGITPPAAAAAVPAVSRVTATIAAARLVMRVVSMWTTPVREAAAEAE